MLIQITPAAFLDLLAPLREPAEHHFTGPSSHHQAENNGSVFHEEGRILANLARILGGPILEIGTDLAISTRYLSQGLDHGDWLLSHIINTVDCMQKWNALPDWPRIVPHCMLSNDFAPRPHCWAFIDGDHRFDGVCHDIRLAQKCGCKWLLFHDTGAHIQRSPNPRHPEYTNPTGVSDAREAVPMLLLPDWTIYDISTGCGMMFAQLEPLPKPKEQLA